LPLWSVAPSRQPELMDDPSLPDQDHLDGLSALTRINALSGTATGLATAILRLSRGIEWTRPLRIIDVASGGGDVTVSLARKLKRRLPRGVGAEVTGIDISPRAVARAQSMADARGVTGVTFAVHDALAEGLPPCDFAINSLFLHHLSDAQTVQILQGMAAAASVGVVVSDLLRSRLGLWLAQLGTTVLSSSRVARVDGPLSVRAARTLAEYRQLLDCSGMESARILRRWPQRALLVWAVPHRDRIARELRR